MSRAPESASICGKHGAAKLLAARMLEGSCLASLAEVQSFLGAARASYIIYIYTHTYMHTYSLYKDGELSLLPFTIHALGSEFDVEGVGGFVNPYK